MTESESVGSGSPLIQEEAAPPAIAGWLDREPSGPWCPAEIAAVLPWAAGLTYADTRSELLFGEPGWSLVGASRRGRLHAHRGDFREDSFRITVAEGYFILAAADGAGSSRLSRIGAEFACEAVVSRVRAHVAGESGQVRDIGATVGQALAEAVAEVEGLARTACVDPRELRTTLLAAIWWPSATGEALVAAQVGDGFIAVRRADGRVERLGSGDTGEFSGEVSCFVPDAGAAARARSVAVIDATDITAIILGTDGVEDPFYPIERHGALLFSQLTEGVTSAAQHFQRQEIHGPVFAPDGDQQLLRWLGFERRGENDDRTLIAAWR